MLALGLTTFAERQDPTRSDCHAWSASPNYHLLSLVCGIMPAEPGFGRVKISPNTGNLEWVDAAMPHPSGTIFFSFRKEGSNPGYIINLPEGVSGTFILEGRSLELRPGKNEFQ